MEKAKTSGLDAINWMKANPSDDDCFWTGLHPGRWAVFDNRVFVSGEKAIAEQEPMGCVQCAVIDAGGSGIPADGGG